MAHITPQPPPTPSWIMTATLDMAITLPDGDVASRDDFHASLWEHADGLLGIHEGAVTAADAAAQALVPTALVIDAAAAPPDRDWVARLVVMEAEWWFRDETAARDAERLVAPLAGCRVQGIRGDDLPAVAARFTALIGGTLDPGTRRLVVPLIQPRVTPRPAAVLTASGIASARPMP